LCKIEGEKKKRKKMPLLKSLLLVLLLCAAALGYPSVPSSLNDRPVVGVLTQPPPSSLASFGDKYIAASYVKYAEASGARVVPIFHDAPKSELLAMFKQINGLLLPGGGASIAQGTQLYEAANYLVQLALEANAADDYFVVSGHCLGYEILAQVLTSDFSILSAVDAENMTLPLHLTSDAHRSRWFGEAPASVREILARENVTLNNHHWAVTPADFDGGKLASVARALSTNWDREGLEFVSTFECIDAPVYAMQFHAEKPLWEWNPTEAINHSPHAIDAMQYFVRFFGREARKSQHTFASQTLLYSQLIYNYAPMYTQHLISDFEQCYVFGPPTNSTSQPEFELF
jgi:gamma-glutamyl hydrolase